MLVAVAQNRAQQPSLNLPVSVAGSAIPLNVWMSISIIVRPDIVVSIVRVRITSIVRVRIPSVAADVRIYVGSATATAIIITSE